jgi:hypothetical protein
MGIIKVLDANHITVRFSEKVGKATAEVASNYSISGGVAVTSASLGTDDQTVTLTTSAIASNTTYTVTCNNVEDLVGNVIRAGSERSFTSGTVGIHFLTGEEGLGTTGFTISPYPGRDIVNADITVAAARPVKVGIMDMEGKEVLRAREYSLVRGKNRVSLNTETLTDGIYLCRLDTRNRVLIRQLVITK